MSGWAAKRFWETVRVAPVPGGFGIMLDTRAARTPAKAPLVLPTERLARAVAAEWAAQQGLIDPRGMPFTASANAAIDKVTPLRDGVVGEIAGYGATDLLCYRATGPATLVARQATAWDPLLGWANAVLRAPLRVTAGVVPVDQPPDSLARLRARVEGFDAFGLTALHDLVSLSGSLVIGLATADGQAEPETLWDLSRIDEVWQAEMWGADEEAAAAAALRRAAFLHAAKFYSLCKV